MSNKFYKAIRAGDLIAIKQLLAEGTKLDAHAWFVAVNAPDNIKIFHLFSQHIQESKESKNKKKEVGIRLDESHSGQTEMLIYYPLDLVSYVDSNLPLFWYAIGQKQWSLVSWFLTIENNAYHYTPGSQCCAEYSVANLHKIIKTLAGIIGPANPQDPEWLESFFLNGLLVWCAAHMEQLNLVQLLLTRLPTKLSFICPDSYPGQTVLWHAARNNRWDIVVRLLEKDSEHALTYQSGCEGQSLSWLAAYHNQWDYVEYFLTLSFDDINGYPSGHHEGRSILWLAAQSGEWPTVKLILEHYPKVNIDAHPINPTEDDYLPHTTVLQFAQWSSQVEVIAMLEQHQLEQQAINLTEKESNSSDLIKNINLFIENHISQFSGADNVTFLQKKLQQAFKAAAIDTLDIQCPPEHTLTFFKKDKITLVQEKIMQVLSEVNLLEVDDDVLIEKIRTVFHSTNVGDSLAP